MTERERISRKKALVKYRRSKKGLLTNTYNKQKERSRIKKIPLPSYSLKELHDKFLDDKKFNRIYNEWIKNNYHKQFKPSIDRINYKKPYTLRNIQILSWAENRFKQTMERRSRKGKVAQMLGDKIIKTYNSQRIVVKETGLSQSNISMVLNGKREYCGGYKWKYID